MSVINTDSERFRRFKLRLVARGFSESEAEDEARNWLSFLDSYERRKAS